MTLLILFLVSVANVFVMAFQSKNINGGHYILAATGSMGIGISQAFVWKAVTLTGAGWPETLTYALGGGIGCVSAMWAHSKVVRKK